MRKTAPLNYGRCEVLVKNLLRVQLAHTMLLPWDPELRGTSTPLVGQAKGWRPSIATMRVKKGPLSRVLLPSAWTIPWQVLLLYMF